MSSITIEWDVSGRDINIADWERHLKSYRFSSVFQNWSYGAASAEYEKVKLQRGYVCENSRVIGLVQAYIKRRLIIGRSVSIIRGPVFKPNVELGQKVEAFRAIKDSFPLLRGNWCTIMPELLETEVVQSVMREAGFQRVMVGYRTYWLDLRQAEEDLWNNLHSKWRNQARKSMGEDIQVTLDDESAWLLDQYQQHKATIGFKGPAADLLRKVDPKDLSVATAWQGEEKIAGTLFIKHGQCATYQVGWTSDEGRRLNAHNLLLWQHILYIKKQGLTALDLGGFDPETAPGISHFKAGLGGVETTLAGTFL